ncbi:hypothetical protein V8E51_002154 [Hyaloscypha variabilis]
MVVEDRPSQKLCVFNLQARLLRTNKESMNIPEEVINQITILTDLNDKCACNSKWVTAATLTQKYAYMIEIGLEYSPVSHGGS